MKMIWVHLVLLLQATSVFCQIRQSTFPVLDVDQLMRESHSAAFRCGESVRVEEDNFGSNWIVRVHSAKTSV